MKFDAIVNSRPNAYACWSKILSAISSPFSPYPRTAFAAFSMGMSWSGWSGYWVSQYGSRLLRMPVSEATLSTSPYRPQLHCGTGCPSASRSWTGMRMWPSSPAMPAEPTTTSPFSMTPAPRPVPTIAETEERWYWCSPNSWRCAYRAAALPSLL